MSRICILRILGTGHGQPGAPLSEGKGWAAVREGMAAAGCLRATRCPWSGLRCRRRRFLALSVPSSSCPSAGGCATLKTFWRYYRPRPRARSSVCACASMGSRGGPANREFEINELFMKIFISLARSLAQPAGNSKSMCLGICTYSI